MDRETYEKQKPFAGEDRTHGLLFARGYNDRLLLLAPWDHHNEHLTIRRDQCLSLNALAEMLCR